MSALNNEEERPSEDTMCIICYEAMDFGQQLAVCFPCKHQFHEACLDKWLASSRLVSSSCCTCRQHIITILVVKFTKSPEEKKEDTWLSLEDRASLYDSLCSHNPSRVKHALAGLMAEVANTSYEGSTMALVCKLGQTPDITTAIFRALKNHWVDEELVGEALLLWLGLLVSQKDSLAARELLLDQQYVVETLVQIMSMKNQVHVYDTCLSILSYMNSACDDKSVIDSMAKNRAIDALVPAMRRGGSEHLIGLSYWLGILYGCCLYSKDTVYKNHETLARYISMVLRLTDLLTNRTVCVRMGKLTLKLAQDCKRIRHSLTRSDAARSTRVILMKFGDDDEELRLIYNELICCLEKSLMSCIVSFALRR
jgi:hypothetical protein